MIIREIKLRNFRNYESETVRFNQGVNVLVGANAQGKTNILEGLVLLSLCRSHRTRNETPLIMNGKEAAVLETVVEDDISRKIGMIIHANGKTLTVNGQPIRRSSDFIGKLNVILFDPTDLNIFISSPKNRRNFIDMELSKVSRNYMEVLNEYIRLLKERNTYLKQKKVEEQYLDSIDEQMVERAVTIIRYRKKLIDAINVNLNDCFAKISGEKHEVSCQYVTCADPNEDLHKQLTEMFMDNRDRDMAMQMTLKGVHHDDIHFFMDGHPVEESASQGQRRMMVLATKLALVSFITSQLHRQPVLLLDDVLSELDSHVQINLLKTLPKDLQTIITTTELNDSLMMADLPLSIQKVEKGHILKKGDQI
ncbi:MAG: DNA replication/repair protein RecF [Erysipelotrichaceae bacterium]|nr:DNA replication/repair protein RecF [Erysipelotrichaceae bacterium]